MFFFVFFVHSKQVPQLSTSRQIDVTDAFTLSNPGVSRTPHFSPAAAAACYGCKADSAVAAAVPASTPAGL